MGTYTAAVITVSANQGDVQLTAAADPEPGFAAAPGATIPASQIQIQGTQGTAPNLTVPVQVNLQSPLVVSTIVEHTPPGTAATIWAVNFNGPSAIDLGSASGQSTLAAGLVANTPVKVFGIPQVQGTLKAYVILYYTGTLPTS